MAGRNAALEGNTEEVLICILNCDSINIQQPTPNFQHPTGRWTLVVGR
jgi:hypothetical protein